MRRHAPRSSSARLFPVSYGSVLHWPRKLSSALGLAQLALTTRSFRRGGASELLRLNVPFADIALMG
eukprot:9588722-Lingulodinium_polyedra.AAC.1